jgi:hypothetical protein
MSGPDLEIEESDPDTEVWRVGFGPDPWAWAPWQYADDEGLFGGRWDDQEGNFRTIYTADSLLGCFLELLAKFRPSRTLLAELDEIEDDGSIDQHLESRPGAVGYRWLENRQYGPAHLSGSYCFITHSRSVAALTAHYPLARHDLTPSDVDVALLKEARDRRLTRSIARWLYDLQDVIIDGVRFTSRHGDEIRMWAIFERAEDEGHSLKVQPTEEPAYVTADLPALEIAFARFGLHWHED